MEEDIKILEDLIEWTKEEGIEACGMEKELPALEHLIKAYKELKENSILVSLVEETIEELDKQEKQELKGLKGQDRYFVKQMYQYKRSVLQELLEKR